MLEAEEPLVLILVIPLLVQLDILQDPVEQVEAALEALIE